ncbi:hypothetical protein [Nocardioides sp. REDSEA-S30_B4]|jgi:hypothetical protein|uniref:hypothetical protein n=1 Tax=Nocardioides sp. REDSEA-S30_B4 TaxID=1811552 RepID=UPI000AB07C11|nr:hypothetical protein [Nocardioides sp. REDSEA-S30_B4]
MNDPHAEHHGHDHDHGHDSDLPEEEKVRRAGHVVLDAVVAADVGGDDPDRAQAAMELVFEHLLEIDAIELLLDEESEELELDISPLIGGVMLVVRRLVAELAARDGVDEETIVMSVRAALDAAAG